MEFSQFEHKPVQKLDTGRTYLSHFPRLPEEVDDTGRFTRAIEATPEGDELVVPSGYYLADSLEICKNISLIFQGNATVEATAPNRDILRISGSRNTENYVLTKPVKRGDRQLLIGTSPCVKAGDLVILTDDTVRHGDKQSGMNTEIHEVKEVYNNNPNLIRFELTRISKGNSVVNQFTGYTNTHMKGIFSTDSVQQMQKIALPKRPAIGRAGVKQKVPVTAKRFYNFQIEAKVEQAIGDFEGICYLIWHRADGSIISKEFLSDITHSEWNSIFLPNLRSPDQAAFCGIHVEAGTEMVGSSGTICFRQPIFQESSTCIVLRDFVRLPKQISQKGMNLYRINPLHEIKVKNFQYVMKEGSERGKGLTLQYVRSALLEGISGYRGAGSGIQVQKSMYVTVKKFRFEKPQKTGSGQGYGVQFYGGCSAIIVKDGYTKDCRHSVDLDSTYDAYISNVLDYNSQGAAFVMSHNGCSSDITFHNCQTLNSIGSGFVASSQGFADPLQCTFYNFKVIGCTAVIQNKANAAVYWYSPCQNSLVHDCHLRFDPREECDFSQLGNAGIRVYPARTEVLISGCEISGFRRGIALQVAGKRQLQNDHSSIAVSDTSIKNCHSVTLIYQGKQCRLSLYNLNCQQIGKQVFEINGKPTFADLVIDGLSLVQSPDCLFTNQGQRFHASSITGIIQGYVRNLRSDLQRENYSSQWGISATQLYLMNDGNSFALRGSGGISTTNPLPDGIVEGQQIILMTSHGKWIIRRGDNMLFNHRANKITLDENRYTLSLIWHNNRWIER